MKSFLLLITLGFFLLITPAQAQYVGAKDGLAARAAFINYQWPALTDDFQMNDFTSGLEIEYIRHLNSFLNLGIPFKIGEARLPTNESGSTRTEVFLSLDLLLQLKFFREQNFIYPYLYGGIGGVLTEELEKLHGVAPVGLGLNFRLSQHIYLSTKAEYRIAFEDLRDNAQIGAGLLFLLGPGTPKPEPVLDTDNDGIPDEQDLCPTEAGTAGLNGCPDTDLDGIADGEDNCPEVAGLAVFDGCPDSDGDGVADPDDNCPNEPGPLENDGCPFPDADGDGIPDAQDDCPGQAGLASLNGCPDRDGDGIADADDNCPDAPGTFAMGGCPDSDGDGVADPDDRCPNTAGPASNRGCPEIAQEDVEVLDFAMQAVQFETGSARLRAESRDILYQIANIMRRYPNYNLRISGHTDSTGSTSTNQKLSEDRAAACYNYLVAEGIQPERMTYAGFGESRPIADNRYRDGREQNRRVEFDLYLED